MTLHEIEQLLITRRLEFIEKRISEAGSMPLDDELKFTALLVECSKHNDNANKCLRVLAENDLSMLDEFGVKRIIEAFAFSVDIHLSTSGILLREALKFAQTEEKREMVSKMIEQCRQKQQSMKATFDEALQDYRHEYTDMLGNEQMLLDASIKLELREYF